MLFSQGRYGLTFFENRQFDWCHWSPIKCLCNWSSQIARGMEVWSLFPLREFCTWIFATKNVLLTHPEENFGLSLSRLASLGKDGQGKVTGEYDLIESRFFFL